MAEALSGVTGSLQGSVQGLANRGQSFIDSIVPPETRNKIVAWVSKFAAEKPMLAARLPIFPSLIFLRGKQQRRENIADYEMSH